MAFTDEQARAFAATLYLVGERDDALVAFATAAGAAAVGRALAAPARKTRLAVVTAEAARLARALSELEVR